MTWVTCMMFECYGKATICKVKVYAKVQKRCEWGWELINRVQIKKSWKLKINK